MNKKTKSITLTLIFIFCSLSSNAKADSWENWKLGVQAYTFNRFTFYEAVDKTKSLGLRYIEAYPGQVLSKEKPDIKFDHNMPSNEKQEVLQKLREAGVKLVNYGVVNLPNDESQCRKVFRACNKTRFI
jgi:sugar phosphate isomerase/epimerase